jgi:glutathione S-transferase
MRLYSHDASPFAARVRIQIQAKKLAVQIEPPPAAPGSAQLRGFSATGRIPILEVDGELIPESRVIMEYLEDRFPEPALRGQSARQAARVRLVCQLVDTYLVPALQPLRIAFRSKLGAAELGEAQRALTDTLDCIEHYLTDGKYTVADELTLADCMLAPMLFYVELLTAAVQPDFRVAGWPRVERSYRAARQHDAAGPVIESMHVATRGMRR